MNNTSQPTEKQKSDKLNEIKIGTINILEFPPTGEKGEISSIELHIPFRFDLCGHRELSEYRKIAVEDLRIKASTLFELTGFLGDLLRESDYKAQSIAEYLVIIGQIGRGVLEETELVEMSFNKYEKQAEVGNEEN